MVRLSEAGHPADAAEEGGGAGRLVPVLDEDAVRVGSVVLFEENVVGVVDKDLDAGLFRAVEVGRGKGVAEIDALAVKPDEGEKENEGGGEKGLHRVIIGNPF
jgi:hypothetical protein